MPLGRSVEHLLKQSGRIVAMHLQHAVECGFRREREELILIRRIRQRGICLIQQHTRGALPVKYRRIVLVRHLHGACHREQALQEYWIDAEHAIDMLAETLLPHGLGYGARALEVGSEVHVLGLAPKLVAVKSELVPAQFGHRGFQSFQFAFGDKVIERKSAVLHGDGAP